MLPVCVEDEQWLDKIVHVDRSDEVVTEQRVFVSALVNGVRIGGDVCIVFRVA
eukprot:COSAG01_NODE_20412_length_955_cov_1.084112_2_plen_52_part_01